MTLDNKRFKAGDLDPKIDVIPSIDVYNLIKTFKEGVDTEIKIADKHKTKIAGAVKFMLNGVKMRIDMLVGDGLL